MKIVKEFRGDIYSYLWKWYYRLRGYNVMIDEEMDQFLSGMFLGITYTLKATR